MAQTTYQPRSVDDVTTQDLIATIGADRDDIGTFEARHAFRVRTASDWRAYAPASPRTIVNTDGGRVYWHNFVESGLL